MKNNPKKGPFTSSIDLNKIPSYRGRFASMDSLTGGSIDMQTECVDLDQASDPEDLRKKIASNQDIRSTPSIILRRKGYKLCP